MSAKRRTTIKVGTNGDAKTGRQEHWIMFGIPDGHFAVFLSDIRWKNATPVYIDDKDVIPIVAVYPVIGRPEGVGVHRSEAIRDGKRIKQIITDGMKHEPALKELFLMVRQWMKSGVLNPDLAEKHD